MSKLTYEQVSAIADQLDANGTKPTAIKVREVLGRGSYSTITAFLEKWQPQETESEIPVVPESLIQLLPSIWSACYREAFKYAETQVESTRLDLAVMKEAKESAMFAVDDLEKRIEELEAENLRLTVLVEQSDIDKADYLEEIRELKSHVVQRDGVIQGLKESLSVLNPAVPVAEPKAESQAGQVNVKTADQSFDELSAQYPHLFTSEGVPKSLQIALGKLFNPADDSQTWDGKGKPPVWYSDVVAVYGESLVRPRDIVKTAKKTS